MLAWVYKQYEPLIWKLLLDCHNEEVTVTDSDALVLSGPFDRLLFAGVGISNFTVNFKFTVHLRTLRLDSAY
jgi:hypothetical protein